MRGLDHTSRDLGGGWPAHPLADEFTNEWAWRFETALRRLARSSLDAEDFCQGVVVMWNALDVGYGYELASAWVEFVARKVGEGTRSAVLEGAPDGHVVALPSTRALPPADGPAAARPQPRTAGIRAALDRMDHEASRAQGPPGLGVS